MVFASCVRRPRWTATRTATDRWDAKSCAIERSDSRCARQRFIAHASHRVTHRIPIFMKAALAQTSAADFLPQSPAARRNLDSLRKAAAHCEGCPLFQRATQTVFGEGKARARMILIGEQPGDREDIEGRPFVGPAGLLLDRCLEEAGIDRDDVYVTNAVKHFKWEPRGKRRIHKKPSLREIAACRPWFDAEVSAVEPELIVCLGATAAQALLGSTFRVTRNRGKVLTPQHLPPVLATVHPSSILRAPDEEARHEARTLFVADLREAAAFVHLKRRAA
ncbi:MAG TPA: UdgX family uracil-DNA binding protein [Acidobacteriaceae bacterium]|nr:UdgX family uracil-DNA binding protein [Acidobacteriaceae bacterium]